MKNRVRSIQSISRYSRGIKYLTEELKVLDRLVAEQLAMGYQYAVDYKTATVEFAVVFI